MAARRKETAGVRDTGHVLINGEKVTMKELQNDATRGQKAFWAARGYVIDEHGNPRRPSEMLKKKDPQS